MLSEFKFGFWLKPKVIDSWNARCDFVAMKYQEGHVGVLECDHGLESARARHDLKECSKGVCVCVSAVVSRLRAEVL